MNGLETFYFLNQVFREPLSYAVAFVVAFFMVMMLVQMFMDFFTQKSQE